MHLSERQKVHVQVDVFALLPLFQHGKSGLLCAFFHPGGARPRDESVIRGGGKTSGSFLRCVVTTPRTGESLETGGPTAVGGAFCFRHGFRAQYGGTHVRSGHRMHQLQRQNRAMYFPGVCKRYASKTQLRRTIGKTKNT